MKISLITLVDKLKSLVETVHNKEDSQVFWNDIIGYKVLQNLIQIRNAIRSYRLELREINKVEDKEVRLTLIDLEQHVSRALSVKDKVIQFKLSYDAITAIDEYFKSLSTGPELEHYNAIRVEDIGKHTYRIWELISDGHNIVSATHKALSEGLDSSERSGFDAKVCKLIFKSALTVAKNTQSKTKDVIDNIDKESQVNLKVNPAYNRSPKF